MAALVVVDVDPDVALERLVEHRGMKAEDVRARMARQATREDRLARADRVIDNSGSPADLADQVEDLREHLRTLGDTKDTAGYGRRGAGRGGARDGPLGSNDPVYSA